MWGLGFAIMEARQKKSLKRLVAAPKLRWQYPMSFLLSRLVMPVSSRARTMEAGSGLMNLVMLSWWLLSGNMLRG